MEKKVKFEEKINELENIINELESGNLEIEESIKKYTKAMELVKDCDSTLKNIEEQVTKIILDNGNMEIFTEDN